MSTTVGRRRRSWTGDEERRIVEESQAVGASVAEVALRHDLKANQLFAWRRQLGVQSIAPHELAPIGTPNAIKRLHEEFKRWIKTQTVLPCAETAAMLFWALLASG